MPSMGTAQSAHSGLSPWLWRDVCAIPHSHSQVRALGSGTASQNTWTYRLALRVYADLQRHFISFLVKITGIVIWVAFYVLYKSIVRLRSVNGQRTKEGACIQEEYFSGPWQAHLPITCRNSVLLIWESLMLKVSSCLTSPSKNPSWEEWKKRVAGGQRCCWPCGNTQPWRCSPKWKLPWLKSDTGFLMALNTVAEDIPEWMKESYHLKKFGLWIVLVF